MLTYDILMAKDTGEVQAQESYALISQECAATHHVSRIRPICWAKCVGGKTSGGGCPNHLEV